MPAPTARDAKAAGLGGTIGSVAVFLIERLTHEASVPLELHRQLFEEMLAALKVCQGQ